MTNKPDTKPAPGIGGDEVNSVRGLLRGLLARAGFYGGSDQSTQDALIDEYTPYIINALTTPARMGEE